MSAKARTFRVGSGVCPKGPFALIRGLPPSGITVGFRHVGATRIGVPLFTRHDLLSGILLALSAAASAWWSARIRRATHPVRLAASFVIAAALALPMPYAMAVAAAALAASRGAALAGVAAPGWRAIVGGGAGAAAACAVAAVGKLPTFAAALASYAALAAVSFAVALLLRTPRRAPRPRRLAFELTNVPAAALLASALRAGDTAAVVSLVMLLLLAGYALTALARALDTLRATNDALASRVTELATLHAIGREILSTLDPERIFAIVERECRKIFDADFFFIGVLDPETRQLRISHRAAGEAASHDTLRPLGDGLASWIVREKRGLRIDDTPKEADALPFRPHMIDGAIRSVIAVPLLVDGRVVGVLSVQSRRARAYDDHQLSVLSTIAQQAAVAVENARHYTLATVDSLTGVSLREYFFKRLEAEHARARRYAGAFSVLMLDVDGFKQINDRQGHLAGDRYLRALGAALRSLLRSADLACRYGGDEFCILLPETDLAGAHPIAERIRQAVAHLVVETDGSAIRTTLSIGIASFPEHDAGELKALLLRADQALYQAKRAGRDRVVPFAA